MTTQLDTLPASARAIVTATAEQFETDPAALFLPLSQRRKVPGALAARNAAIARLDAERAGAGVPRYSHGEIQKWFGGISRTSLAYARMQSGEAVARNNCAGIGGDRPLKDRRRHP